ncbi:MAG TPA: DUF3826 domain-containing protein, partial [Tepidisphaeraceae bacterium]|nr:DUF3826 domain-containing protein [Tepidisphaeraceae bacterium]
MIKRQWSRWTVLMMMAWGMGAVSIHAAPKMPPAAPAEDPASLDIAERRSAGMIDGLRLDDAKKAARVRQHLVNFIITLKNIHEGRNAPTGDAKHAALEQARDALYAGFDEEALTDTQRLIIKNGLSANHYRINYDAFLNLVPALTDEEKRYIHEQLAEVCEHAILLNSGEAKGELFRNRRGRINNYLS